MANEISTRRLPPRVVLAVRADDLPREVHDQANEMLSACYAEAGYSVPCRWDGRRWVNVVPVPEDVLRRAARLVCDRLGLPYTLVEDTEDMASCEVTS